MAALITYAIATQRFESIRDLIGGIIATEFAGQKTLTSNTLFDANVYIERFIAYDRTELPAINVFYVSSKNEAKTRYSDTMINTYYIDVSCYKDATTSERGDKLASIDCQKLLGAIRAILSSAEYQQLGLSSGILQHKEVTEIGITTPTQTNDGLNVITGRVVLTVKANEINGDLSHTHVGEINFNWLIEETNKGNKIKVTNT